MDGGRDFISSHANSLILIGYQLSAAHSGFFHSGNAWAPWQGVSSLHVRNGTVSKSGVESVGWLVSVHRKPPQQVLLPGHSLLHRKGLGVFFLLLCKIPHPGSEGRSSITPLCVETPARVRSFRALLTQRATRQNPPLPPRSRDLGCPRQTTVLSLVG